MTLAVVAPLLLLPLLVLLESAPLSEVAECVRNWLVMVMQHFLVSSVPPLHHWGGHEPAGYDSVGPLHWLLVAPWVSVTAAAAAEEAGWLELHHCLAAEHCGACEQAVSALTVVVVVVKDSALVNMDLKLQK